jgi:hypothetical protein
MPKSATKIAPVDRLREVVEARIATAPFEYEGQQWAAAPQAWYAEQLGVCVRTIGRLIKSAPFDHQRRQIDGKVTTLVRVGTPLEKTEKTEKHYANILASIWRKKIGRRASRDEYGQINGLVQNWPKGKSIDIFKSVLDNWAMFAAGAKQQIDMFGGTPRYWKHPSLSVMRRFYGVAVEMHVMLLQDKGLDDLDLWLWVAKRDPEAEWQQAGQHAKAKHE